MRATGKKSTQKKAIKDDNKIMRIHQAKKFVPLAEFELRLELKVIQDCINVDSYNRTLDVAKRLTQSLVRFFNGGGKITSETLEEIERVIRNDGYSYYAKKEFDKDPLVKQRLIELINVEFPFSPSFSMYLMKNDNICIEPIMKQYSYTLDNKFISDIDIDEMNDDYEQLVKLLVVTHKVKIVMTPAERDKYIADEDANSFIIYSLMDDPTIVVTANFTKNMTRYHNLELLKKTLVCGGVLSTEILEEACLSRTSDRLEKLKFILDNNIEPTETAFMNIVTKGKCDEDNNYYYRRNNRYNNTKSNSQCIAESMMNLLTDYGYPVTYDNLKVALKSSLVIKNIERFNIKFDSTYLHICSDVGLYPYKTKDIAPDITCLTNECKKAGNLSNIKKVLTINKLTPNTDCMHEACKHRNNVQTIKYLVSKGGSIDFECLENIIGTMYNKNLTYIFAEFKKANTVTLKDSKDVVKNEPAKKAKCGSKKAVKDLTDSSDNMEESDVEEEEDIIDRSESSEDIEDEDSEESVKSAKSVKSKKSVSKSASNVTAIATTTTVTNTTVNATTNTSTPASASVSAATPVKTNFVKVVSTIPTDFSCTEKVFSKLSPAMKKTLKMTPKNASINYIDFRKLVLEYHKNNDLIVNNKITLKSPFLYNGATTIEFNEINEWVYNLLNSSQNAATKTTKIATGVTNAKAKAKAANKVAAKTSNSKKAIKDDESINSEENNETDEEEQQIATIHDVVSEDESDTASINSKNRKERRAAASKGKIVKKTPVKTPVKTANVTATKTTTKTKVTAAKATVTKSKTIVAKNTTNIKTQPTTPSVSESDEGSEEVSVSEVPEPKKPTLAPVKATTKVPAKAPTQAPAKAPAKAPIKTVNKKTVSSSCSESSSKSVESDSEESEEVKPVKKTIATKKK